MLADPDLTKAFQELQVQVMKTREEVRHIEAEISICERKLAAFTITKQTIEEFEPGNECFVGCGRMFVRRERSDVIRQLEDDIVKNQERIVTLKQAKEYQETKVKQTENNIREMINTKKNAPPKK